MMGVADFPIETLKALNIHPDAVKKRKEKKKAASDAIASSQSASTGSSDDLSRQTSESSVQTQSNNATPSGASQFNLSDSLSRLGSHDTQSPSDRPGSPGLASISAALRGQLGDRLDRRGSPSKGSPTNENPPQLVDTALGTSKGIGKILKAGFESPMDFTHALAKGFHNAPKLYGDDTVRKSDQITDFRSGVRAASKEFGFGLYDGITGLVTQPIRGAKKEGAAGFIKGVGKGIGGVVLKTQAGAFAVPAYTMKGIWKELALNQGKSVNNYIIAARTAQGYAELNDATPAERLDIIERWISLQANLKKKKDPDEALRDWALGMRSKRLAWQDAQSKKITQHLKDRKWTRSESLGTSGKQKEATTTATGEASKRAVSDRDAGELRHASTVSENETLHVADAEERGIYHASTMPDVYSTDDRDLEEAIRLSVAESSRGNAQEDGIIERAIRASVAELQNRQPSGGAETDDDEIESVLAASSAEAERLRQYHAESHEEEQADLVRALQESREHLENPALGRGGYQARRIAAAQNSQAAGDEGVIRETAEREQEGISGLVPDHDNRPMEEMPPAYDELHGRGPHQTDSKTSLPPPPGDEELQRALQESLQSHDQERSEEDIVMEYVKKQSLLEQQHREAMAGLERQRREALAGKGKGAAAAQNKGQDDDDEEFKKAIKLSMQREGQSGEGSGHA